MDSLVIEKKYVLEMDAWNWIKFIMQELVGYVWVFSLNKYYFQH